MTPDHDHSPKDGAPSVVVAHWSRLSDLRLGFRLSRHRSWPFTTARDRHCDVHPNVFVQRKVDEWLSQS
jgi:hypothetical protein